MIIDRGRLVAVGRLDELLEARVRAVEIRVEGLSADTVEQLRLRSPSLIRSGDTVQFVLEGGEEDVPSTLRLIADAGGRLRSLVPLRETLEDVFLRQVKGGAS